MSGEHGPTPDRARKHVVAHWRVLLGAALMTVAAAGVVFAHRVSQQPPATRYLVLTEEVAAGQAVTSDKLGSVALDLPRAVEGIAEENSDEVVGRIATHTLASASLLIEADLAKAGQFVDPDEQLVPVSIEPGRLRRSSLSAGRTVHVLSSADGSTSLVTTARVSSIGDSESDGIGTQSGVLVELAVPDTATSEAVTNASVNGTVTLVVPSPSTSEEP